MVEPVPEPDSAQQLRGALRGAPLPAQLERHLHVFLRCQCRNQLEALKDEPDLFAPQPRSVVFGKSGEIRIIEDHCATCRCIQTGKQAE